MFKFLKEKISSWAKKISENKAKEVPTEEEELELKKEESKKPEKKTKQKKEKKPKKEKKKEIKKESVKEISNFKEAPKRPEQKEERELGEKIWDDIKDKAEEDSIKFPDLDKKKGEEEIPSSEFTLNVSEADGQKSQDKQKIEEEPVEKREGWWKRKFGKKEEEKSEETEKKQEGIFTKIKEKFTKTKISEEEFSQYSEDLLMILIENNVAFEVADKILAELKEKVVNKELSRKDLEEEIKNSLKETIEDILVEPFDIIKKIKEKKEQYVILFCGINGTGKTTTIAKLATLLKKEDISCVMAAGDTFRAASIEQLKLHGERTKTKVIAHEYGSDPASVGFDAIQYAKKSNIKVVLIDTAGRMHTAKNLLREIEKIANVCKPDIKIFVGESITGNDAVEQVKAFNELIGIDGIILSKADIDEKGGTALSVGYVTGKPILFLGIGQEYKDLELFNKKKFIEKLGL